MKKTIQLLLAAITVFALTSFHSPKDANINWSDCTWNGFQLFGNIQVVDAFPDVKVQIVDAFPDIKVKLVDAFPDECGKWQMVDAFPNTKVQFVDAFPDVKIQYVDAFQGKP